MQKPEGPCLVYRVQTALKVLWAKPVVLMTSYHTKDFVEEQENGCPIGQLYIQMYAVRGR